MSVLGMSPMTPGSPEFHHETNVQFLSRHAVRMQFR